MKIQFVIYEQFETVEQSLTVFLLYLVNKLVAKRQKIIINTYIIYKRLSWRQSASYRQAKNDIHMNWKESKNTEKTYMTFLETG